VSGARFRKKRFYQYRSIDLAAAALVSPATLLTGAKMSAPGQTFRRKKLAVEFGMEPRI
jgi:hypothetical protein